MHQFCVTSRKSGMAKNTPREGGPTTTENFFLKIMNGTDTQTKSKKDPYIKTFGRPPAITAARGNVLEVLDTKQRNRITIKMDISYTDHSHIIGKGGKNIQRVMDETGCHIHFPDSNRNSLTEKSNQVSIAGQPGGVEKARCRVRELLPLVFSFHLPSSTMSPPPDLSSQDLLLIQHNYAFTVSIRTWHCDSFGVVIVKGCQKDFALIRQGLTILMDYLTGSKNGHLPLVLMFDLKDDQELNTALIHQLMELLKVKVIIRPKPKQNSKTVIVHGAEKDSRALFEVRRQLLGLDESAVPLCCDKHFVSRVHPILLSSLAMNGQMMHFEDKLRDSSRSAFKRVLELAFSSIPISSLFLLNNLENLQLPLSSSFLPMVTSSPTQQAAASLSKSSNSTMYDSYINSCINPNPVPKNEFGLHLHESLFSGTFDQVPSIYGNISCDKSSTLSTPTLIPDEFLASEIKNLCVDGGHNKESATGKALFNLRNWSDISEDCGHVSERSVFTENKSRGFGLEESSSNEKLFSHISEAESLTRSSVQSDSKFDATSYLREKIVGTVGCERKSPMDSSLFDYEEGKLLASKVIQKPLNSVTRIPTNIWAGFGFSKSMPEFVIKEKWQTHLNQPSVPETIQEEKTVTSYMDNIWYNSNSVVPKPETFWKLNGNSHEQDNDLAEKRSCMFSSSNYFDCYPSKLPLISLSSTDLPHLLCKLGVLTYVDVFQQNEIDLTTFLKLTSKDLQNLNIPLVPRQKMLSAISILSKQEAIQKMDLTGAQSYENNCKTKWYNEHS
ncbi:protein bicaudal C homolog 1-B-like isoform X2 [Limulus polyphemus]|uniref:Protein bicaudal C homolog 1-B-like isoform X2 n=1 Tax=Limulus polyphemus TaxID=6850 RepID=A0ABM1SZU2_LIMPO|nr:protein bicaudal C homolog 1-B-like isoform X2 [Limulus polyphemus]